MKIIVYFDHTKFCFKQGGNCALSVASTYNIVTILGCYLVWIGNSVLYRN